MKIVLREKIFFLYIFPHCLFEGQEERWPRNMLSSVYILVLLFFLNHFSVPILPRPLFHKSQEVVVKVESIDESKRVVVSLLEAR